MSINNNSDILYTIHKYNLYVKNKGLPPLKCGNDDGTHLNLISRMDNDDNVYLYCLTCDWEKQAGIVTATHLLRRMQLADSA